MNPYPKLAIAGLFAAFAACSATAFAEDGWITSFEQARETARAEGKSILVNFTGSDW